MSDPLEPLAADVEGRRIQPLTGSRFSLVRSSRLPMVAAFATLLLGCLFFWYDEGRDNFEELTNWLAWVELICLGPGMALLVYVLLERQQRREALLARQLEMADREHLLHLGHLAAGVAHEVRNPLHNMRLIVDRLLGDDSEPAAREHWYQRLGANLDRVQGAVELVFQQARQPDERVFEAVDLREEVELAAEEVGAPVRWETNGDATATDRVFAPPDALRVILQNLLRNAREAETEPSVLRLEAHRRGCRLVIRNRGDLAGSSANRPETHLGVGLPLCRLLARGFDAALMVEQSGPWVVATLDLPEPSEPRE